MLITFENPNTIYKQHQCEYNDDSLLTLGLVTKKHFVK